MARDCPQCGITNPSEAQRCDCGYDFTAHRVLGSYVTDKQRVQMAKEAIKGRKVANVAAGLGFFQGLFNVVFGIIGWPPEFHPQDQVEAVVVVVLRLLQGTAMLVFAVATYKGKLWGAYGLCAIALLYAAMSMYAQGTPGWTIPALLYLAAAVSLHRVVRATEAIKRLP